MTQYVADAGDDLADGLTWTTAKATVAAALAADDRVLVGAGSFPVPATLDGTDRPGVRIEGRGWNQTTLALSTGSVGVDFTGSQRASLADLSLVNVDNPSTVGVLFARSTTHQFVEFTSLDRVRIDMGSDPAANGGVGRIAVYNNAAELANYRTAWLTADVPLVLTGPNCYGITSALTGHEAAITSMSTVMVDGESTLTSPSSHALVIDGVWQTRFDGYMSRAGGDHAYAIKAIGDTRGIALHGHIEGFPGTLWTDTSIRGLDLAVTQAPTDTVPMLLLDGDGGGAPGLDTATIKLTPTNSNRFVLLATSSLTNQLGVRNSTIHLPAGASIEAGGGRCTGNIVLAEDDSPSIGFSYGQGFRSFVVISRDRLLFSGGDHIFDPTGRLGFFGANGTTKPVVTGNRGGDDALSSLLRALSTLGLIQDGTTSLP